MPTYEYECEKCGERFERRQPFSEVPITECPECHGKVRRIVSGGAGFIFRESEKGRANHRGTECNLEHVGKTCCGREERCEKPPCGGDR
jgi:putative FmdB family regulatory protein